MKANLILFDDAAWEGLKPMTLTRPIAELRVGILTIKEKWERYLDTTASFFTSEYLQEKFPMVVGEDNIWVNGSICPNRELVESIVCLERQERLCSGEIVIAFRCGRGVAATDFSGISAFKNREYTGKILKITKAYDIFKNNRDEIAVDFLLLTRGRKSETLNSSVRVYGDHPIFIDEGALVESAVINTKGGPVYIGRDAEVMEGALVRGPVALCDHAVLKMGAKVYEGTTLGPWCKCGGELSDVVFTGYSNKAHDGFIGNSVVGEWCNIGAGVNCSNLKNGYEEVKLWDYGKERFLKTGLQFCGAIIGDYSKIGIGMIINSGTVLGVGTDLHGSGYPRNFIDSFQQRGTGEYLKQSYHTFIKGANTMMQRRNKILSEADLKILKYLYDQ